jgi:hypothetical protein
MSKARPRPVIALFAAYVLALQAMLLPLSVAAAPVANGLCAATQTNDGAPGHPTGCPCAAGCGTHCCSSALTAPPAAGVLLTARSFEAAVPAPIFMLTVRAAGRSPQLARAPPLA